MAIQGSCLCTAVRYEVEALASPIGFCHCRTCQKAHAAPFAPTARVKPSSFRWLEGEAHLRDFASSPGKIRRFCGLCGSHIVAVKEGQDEWILRVGTLDDDPQVRPVVRIWTAHDRPWLDGTDLPSLPEGFPPSA